TVTPSGAGEDRFGQYLRSGGVFRRVPTERDRQPGFHHRHVGLAHRQDPQTVRQHGVDVLEFRRRAPPTDRWQLARAEFGPPDLLRAAMPGAHARLRHCWSSSPFWGCTVATDRESGRKAVGDDTTSSTATA